VELLKMIVLGVLEEQEPVESEAEIGSGHASIEADQGSAIGKGVAIV
jgi:hypothetical protein